MNKENIKNLCVGEALAIISGGIVFQASNNIVAALATGCTALYLGATDKIGLNKISLNDNECSREDIRKKKYTKSFMNNHKYRANKGF